MKNVKLYVFMFITGLINICSVPAKNKEIQWLTLAEAQAAYEKEPRPILIDLFTDWCGWCKVMDRETYAHPEVINYINGHFYAVKLDAESKSEQLWAGKKYNFKTSYNANELAVYLLNGQMSYPTTVFLVSPGASPVPLPGFLKPKDIEAPLKFFGDAVYKKSNFQDYYKHFTSSWK